MSRGGEAGPTRPTGPTGPTRPGAVGRAIRGQRHLVALSTALLMLWQACESLVPVAIGLVIDRAVVTGRVGHLIAAVALLAVLFTVLSLSYRFGSRTGLRASRQAAHALRVEVAAVVLDPATRPRPDRHSGEVVWAAGSDPDRVGTLCLFLPRATGAVVSVAITAIVLLRLSTTLGLVVLIAAPILLAIVHRLGVPLERRAGTEQAHAAEAGALATDLLRGLRVLKGFGGELAATARYRSASRRSRDATVRAATTEAAYDAMTLALTLLFLAAVTLIAGRLAAQGRISVGDLVAAVGLAQFLLGPLGGLAQTGAVLARARASATRLDELLATPRHAGATTALPTTVQGALGVRLDGAEVSMGAGEILGVAAEPAIAESLVRLLAEPVETAVTVDGVDLAALDPVLARRTVLVAAHDAALFDETVASNVGSGPLVAEAITAAAVDQIAETLPAGLDTAVGERGSALSGGQRQRVALARALAADAPVLVLHDPTTAVDSVTEDRIAEAMRRLRAGRTTLLVTTSPRLLAACDRVVLLDGPDSAVGDHHSLGASNPRYRELVQA